MIMMRSSFSQLSVGTARVNILLSYHPQPKACLVILDIISRPILATGEIVSSQATAQHFLVAAPSLWHSP